MSQTHQEDKNARIPKYFCKVIIETLLVKCNQIGTISVLHSAPYTIVLTYSQE